MKFPKSLQDKLLQRQDNKALRQLPFTNELIDFASNDYIGFAKNKAIFSQAHQMLLDEDLMINGATGSRLLSGNHILYTKAENHISDFHQSEAALIFNSGYDANVGFFSTVPQRNDVILYDELCHASIRDGIQMSKARSFKFGHNDLDELKKLILKFSTETNEIYIATESIFSMDGDAPNLEELAKLSEEHDCLLVLDEAHALGVFGEKGEGLVQSLNLQNKVFARIRS